MVEWLLPLLATQVSRVQSPVPTRPTISVEKVALFSKPVSVTRAIKIIDRLKNCSEKAKVFRILRHGSAYVGLEIPHSKNSLSLLMGSVFKRYMHLKKKAC
jgi:hypothetical protein